MAGESAPGADRLQVNELKSKLERIRALLAVEDLDAALLTRSENFTWLTGGGQAPGGSGGFDPAGVLVTADRAFVITSGGATPFLPEAASALDRLEYPWSETTLYHTALNALHRGASVGADIPMPVTREIESQIGRLRMVLTPEEQDRFRTLYSDARQILDDVCGQIKPGKTERSIAARCSGHFLSEGFELVHVFVAADERDAIPYPIPSPQPVVDRARVSVAVRRDGLVASFTRLVCFSAMPEPVARRQQAAAQVADALIGATRPGVALGQIFQAGVAACQAAGFPDAWRQRNFGGPTGYRWREAIASPDDSGLVEPGHALTWSPFIEGVFCEETVLVTNTGPERV